MAGQALEAVEEEKEMGVRMNTVRYLLGQITRVFHYRDHHVFIQLYNQYRYVRSHLELSTQAWAPWSAVEDTRVGTRYHLPYLLEKVQQRAVKLVAGTEYEDRLMVHRKRASK